jgi:hypothetical protein
MRKNGNPEGRRGETVSQTTLRTGRILADRQKHERQAAQAKKAGNGKGK